MKDLWNSSLFNAENAPYLEQIYETYLKEPKSIPEEWKKYFEQSLQVNDVSSEPIHSEIQESFKQLARHPRWFGSAKGTVSAPVSTAVSGVSAVGAASAGSPARSSNGLRRGVSLQADKRISDQERKQMSVLALIDAYRLLGHLHANLDPLERREELLVPELMLSFYHLSEADLSTQFEAGTFPGPKLRTLKQIIEDVRTVYCKSIASEYMHIPDSPERVWVETRIESLLEAPALTTEKKHHILKRLTAAEGLEKYLGSKYPGAKRFSLEGNDSLIVFLDELIRKGDQTSIKEIVMGMAHRGRLNVLVNILGKSPSQLFDEFEGKHDLRLESGDVKYHQGFSSDFMVNGKSVHLSLAFNPSHLEIVNPVVCGSVRARLERRKDKEKKEVLSVLMHGDASFAGQGIVMETLNMSRTNAYEIGGTIHIIINNQIGFTTSNPRDARSTLYCSDIGKMLEIPIFYVNADDPEAVVRIAQLAIEYRNQFKKDVIVNLIGYRRHGHNEVDEPSATQPIMYQIIRKHPTVWTLYSEKLIKEGSISKEKVEELNKEYRDILDKRQATVELKGAVNHTLTEYASNWQIYSIRDWRAETTTKVELALIKALGKQLEILPEGFVLQTQVQKIIDNRKKMTEGTLPIDWGYAEIMAYATLLNDGFPVRMSGQDCARGTFFHRHAVLHNQTDGAKYTPLCHVSDNQAAFTIYDSLLSEAGVLGFEYGYASTDPTKLVIWEAQFGDFANEAQVLIDQFISSGEQKWGRLCGLVLYLPHGYEGQGPEHSSARLERYLQLCAEHNIQVCVPSTPAQIFHLLRRQMIRQMRKPLVVLTPKSFLRNKDAVSRLEDLSESSFLPIINEVGDIPKEAVKRVVLCSGKVYYDLLEKRRQENIVHVAILRIEQLYPFPEIELSSALSKYSEVEDIVWCQEEPQNQGAWYSSQHHLLACLTKGQHLRYVGRKPAAAPAVGYYHLHEEQQETLVKQALIE